MAYDDRIKDQIQTANDIVEIIGQYVPLKRSGRNFKALCPFHQEKTPSFMVQPEKQIFRCFGCGVGGDVFNFVMRYENLNFPEALRQLAERAHIQLPEKSALSHEKAGEAEQLYEIYHIAAEYYHQEFLHPVRGKTARDYFMKRQFDPSLAQEFGLGWAPEGWQNLFEFLAKKGLSDSLLLKSGLIQRSSKGNLYDVFRGRLLFPIRNLRGKVVAFGGRVIKDSAEGPKYLNSSENPIFHKRRELFGLFFAKKFIDRDRPQMLVMEGYFDFLRAYQQGFKSVVATLGTALTDDHVLLLKRFAEEAVVVYDGDKAGEAATLRGLEVFLEGGMNVKLVRMPHGYDPDDFLIKEGSDAFRKILGEAQDFFDYKLEILLERFDRGDSLGLMRITNEFLETLAKVKNVFLLDRYLRRLAASLGIDEQSLRTELSKLKEKMKSAASGSAGFSSKAARVSSSEVAFPTSVKLAQSEILLLALFVDEPALRDMIAELVSEEDFQDVEMRSLYQSLILIYRRGKELTWPQALCRIQSENLKEELIASTDFEWSLEDKQKAFYDCLEGLKKRGKERKLESLRRLIAQAEKAGDSIRVEGYVKEYQNLLKHKA